MSKVFVIDTRDKFHGYRKDQTTPFDKFYLVPPDLEDQVNRLTPYALILPLTEQYESCLNKYKLDVKKLKKDKYQVVLPIHMSRATGARKTASSDEIQPTFIARKRWWRKIAKLQEFIPEDVTLVTPVGPITPMCSSCEQSLQHMAGECTVGTGDCLKHLKVTYKCMDEKKHEKREAEHLVQLQTKDRH